MAPRPDVLPAPFVEMHRCATPALSADPAPTIEEELAAIKRMVGQVIQSSIPGVGPGGMPDALFKHYLRLLEQEVARDLAERVVGAVRNELTAVQLQSDSAVSQAVLRHLAAMIPVAESVVAPGRAADGRPYTVALVGPTGVGKTTTIAKLAAAYQLRHGRKVGLITCDTYRIAAVDQLRTYAEIIGVPLKVVMTAEEMGAACRAFADCDAILIDTAGRSPQDGARLEELGRFIEAAAPHETHLVLSGAAGERGMINAAERFAVVSPNRVIFTKLDEAVNYGVLLNVAGRLRTMLSFVTMGQEVPEHIEEGRADHLARLVLEGGVYR
jgi:flagellar biosynthesis protein FlhF